MPVGLVSGLIGGLAGLFGGGKQQQVNSNFNQNQSQSGTQYQSQSGTQFGTTTPNLSPIQQQLLKLFSGGATNLFNQTQDLNGYKASGIQNINQSSDAADTALRNVLSQRGLTYSPAQATAETGIQTNRLNQQNQFLNSIPLLQTQLKQNALSGLFQAFGVQPTAISQTGGGTSTGTGSFTGQSNSQGSGQNMQWGNPMGGLFSGIGAGLLGPNGSGGTNLGNILGMFGYGKGNSSGVPGGEQGG